MIADSRLLIERVVLMVVYFTVTKDSVLSRIGDVLRLLDLADIRIPMSDLDFAEHFAEALCSSSLTLGSRIRRR